MPEEGLDIIADDIPVLKWKLISEQMLAPDGAVEHSLMINQLASFAEMTNLEK